MADKTVEPEAFKLTNEEQDQKIELNKRAISLFQSMSVHSGVVHEALCEMLVYNLVMMKAEELHTTVISAQNNQKYRINVELVEVV